MKWWESTLVHINHLFIANNLHSLFWGISHITSNEKGSLDFVGETTTVVYNYLSVMIRWLSQQIIIIKILPLRLPKCWSAPYIHTWSFLHFQLQACQDLLRIRFNEWGKDEFWVLNRIFYKGQNWPFQPPGLAYSAYTSFWSALETMLLYVTQVPC